MPPSTRSIKIILFEECGVHLAIPFCISRSSVVPPRRVGYFLDFFCQFSSFRWSNFDLELIYFALSMNTSSYSPIASGTYNRWKVEFVLKTKIPKHQYNAGYGGTLYNAAWWFLFLYILNHLLFEENASLKCVYSGLTPLSTVFQSYHEGVWLLQGAQCGLVVPILIHIIRDFPVLLFAALLC